MSLAVPTPSINKIMGELNDDVKSLFVQLRERMGSLDVKEKVMFDGFAKEWTPAYYLGDKQFFHVHFDKKAVIISMPRNKKFVEKALNSSEVSQRLKEYLRRTRWIALGIKNRGEVEEFVPLVKLKIALVSVNVALEKFL